MKYQENQELNNPDFNPDDYAPIDDTPEESPVKKKKSKNNTTVYIVLTVVLTLLLAVFGVVFATDTQSESVTDNVLSYYEDATSCEFYKTADDCDFYTVYYKDYIIGYSAVTTEKGFSDNIEVMVCFEGDSSISNVVILSQNETSGLGDKILSSAFLKQFTAADVTKDTEFTLISGATTSSRAVTNAVKAVLSSSVNLSSIEKDTEKEVLTPEELEEVLKKDKNSQNSSDTTSKDDDESGGAFSPDTGFFANGRITDTDDAYNNNNGSGNMSVDGSDVTTVYETLTDETTSAQTTAKSETTASVTKAPVTTATPVTTAQPKVTTAETTAAPETTGAEVTTASDETTGEVTG